jgi:hypothetical protein
MTEEETHKLIKKWEPLLTAEISSDATVLLIEPMETPVSGEEYTIPQNAIDDLMKFHGRDAIKEVEEILKMNEEMKND